METDGDLQPFASRFPMGGGVVVVVVVGGLSLGYWAQAKMFFLKTPIFADRKAIRADLTAYQNNNNDKEEERR